MIGPAEVAVKLGPLLFLAHVYLNGPKRYTLPLALRSFLDPAGLTDRGCIRYVLLERRYDGLQGMKGNYMKSGNYDRRDGLIIAYIGGGSRGWAWKLMSDLAAEERLSGTVRLYDIDRPAAEANARIGNRLASRPDVPGKWRYEVAADLGSALDGVDFVVASILPGSFQDMASDVHAPEEYGIFQSVGDTTGPGGLVRALRTIPQYVEIGRAIREHCPGAWVINYTNPMALCVRTLYETFPAVKAIGCCHEVFGTRKLLAAVAREELGARQGEPGPAATMADIEVNVLGINHFTWLNRASFRGEDLFPHYRSFIEKHPAGFELGGEGSWKTDWFSSAELVKFDLFKRYGLIAAAGDRHLAEFMPPWYLRDRDAPATWKFTLTPVSWRIENAAQLRAKSQRLASGEEAFTLERSGEEGVAIMKALLGLGSFVTNANLPNRGQVEGLPAGSIVETNALFSRDSARPLLAGRLPHPIEGMMARHVANHETILRAAVSGEARAALPAFMNDPLMTAAPADAERLFERMLAATGLVSGR
jgi:galacturan 1,4-alpha-galacturonidase